MCRESKAILIRILNGEKCDCEWKVSVWQFFVVCTLFSLSVLTKIIYSNKYKQTSLATAATRNQSPQEMKMPASNCHHIES